jgi:HPr kinase/phosphorylase
MADLMADLMADPVADQETLHASCVLVGEDAILVRGAPGAGKSLLCRDLIAAAERAGRFARLVSDDRTRLEARNGRLVARAVKATAGLVETRGIGIYGVPYERAALVRLVVDLVDGEPERMPDEAEATIFLCGIPVDRLLAPRGRPLAETVLTRLRLIPRPDQDTLVTL